MMKWATGLALWVRTFPRRALRQAAEGEFYSHRKRRRIGEPFDACRCTGQGRMAPRPRGSMCFAAHCVTMAGNAPKAFHACARPQRRPGPVPRGAPERAALAL